MQLRHCAMPQDPSPQESSVSRHGSTRSTDTVMAITDAQV